MPAPRTPPWMIRAVGRRVECSSETPLAFEPKGWQRAFRAGLRSALARLEIGPDEILAGIYSGPSGAWPIDAENVLFYNVGVGAFVQSAANGLRFERVFGDPRSIGVESRFPLAASYGPVAPGSPFSHAARGETIATLSGLAVAADGEAPSATEIWWAVRAAVRGGELASVERTGLCGGRFGLTMTLAVPAARSSMRAALHGAALVKPVVDGVVAAFTAHDGGDLEGVSVRLGERLGVRPDVVARELTATPSALLSTQRLVVCRSRGVQWLPPDDRCVACELLIVRDAKGPEWRLSGSLFEAQAASSAAGAGARTPKAS